MSKSKTLAAPPPFMIDDTNLSRAWARLLLRVLYGTGTEVAPLVLSLSGFGEDGAVGEDPAVRQALDRLLKRKGRRVVDDVAFTIFPQRLWQMSRRDRARLFALYRATFPRWQSMNRKANGRGLYFERMVMYGRGPCDGNQLEWILSQFNSRAGVRRDLDPNFHQPQIRKLACALQALNYFVDLLHNFERLSIRHRNTTSLATPQSSCRSPDLFNRSTQKSIASMSS